MKTFMLLVSLTLAASAEIGVNRDSWYSGTGENEYENRYIVFPGLDAAADEIAEWANGWTTPFNVYFGPKPYVVGWIGGGGSFAPEDPEIGDPDDEDEGDVSYEDSDYFSDQKLIGY